MFFIVQREGTEKHTKRKNWSLQDWKKKNSLIVIAITLGRG